MASWLVRSSPDRAVQVRALAGDIVLCCVRQISDLNTATNSYVNADSTIHTVLCKSNANEICGNSSSVLVTFL